MSKIEKVLISLFAITTLLSAIDEFSKSNVVGGIIGMVGCVLSVIALMLIPINSNEKF